MSAVYLVRHGQASWGRSDYDKLSELGERQSSVLGESLKWRLGGPPDVVVSGAMKRHLRTCELALAAIGADRVDVREDARWNEYDHEEVIVRHKPLYRNKILMRADFARRKDPRRAFQEFFDEALERWVGGAFDDEYAEPWPALGDRAEAALADLFATLERSQNAVVFTSGGAISALCARLIGLDRAGWLGINRVMANAAVTKVVSGRGGKTLVTFNEHGHFEGRNRDLLTYR